MIHCIGNSHINTFSKQPNLTYENVRNEYFIGHWLGPVIAYNFFEHHLYNSLRFVEKISKENDYITLIVGEVDCRFHLPRQADLQKRADKEVVNECISRFIRSYDVFMNNGYKVVITGTHPTTTGPHNDDPNNPVWGSVERRNNVCLIWNGLLKEESIKRNVPYISIYDYLVDDNNITKMEYFWDYCHLNGEKVFGFVETEFKKAGLI